MFRWRREPETPYLLEPVNTEPAKAIGSHMLQDDDDELTYSDREVMDVGDAEEDEVFVKFGRDDWGEMEDELRAELGDEFDDLDEEDGEGEEENGGDDEGGGPSGAGMKDEGGADAMDEDDDDDLDLEGVLAELDAEKQSRTSSKERETKR